MPQNKLNIYLWYPNSQNIILYLGSFVYLMKFIETSLTNYFKLNQISNSTSYFNSNQKSFENVG